MSGDWLLSAPVYTNTTQREGIYLVGVYYYCMQYCMQYCVSWLAYY
jgi:hypothetical protein